MNGSKIVTGHNFLMEGRIKRLEKHVKILRIVMVVNVVLWGAIGATLWKAWRAYTQEEVYARFDDHPSEITTVAGDPDLCNMEDFAEED